MYPDLTASETDTYISSFTWATLGASSLNRRVVLPQVDADDSPHHRIIRDMNLFSDMHQNQRLPADERITQSLLQALQYSLA